MRPAPLTLLAAPALAAGAVLAAGCGGSEEKTRGTAHTQPVATRPAPSTGDADQTLDIAALPVLKFDKDQLRARAGAPLTVRFDNREDGIPHNWALYGDDGFTDAVAGKNGKICAGPCSEDLTVRALEAGTYFFRCDVHPVQMTGELIVE